VSGEATGQAVDLRAVADGAAAGASGVRHGAILVAFAEAALGADPAALDKARGEVLSALGPEALVDAAAVIGNFQRMVRIADSTGIPLDTTLDLLTGEMRRELGIDSFSSAANTPASGATKRLIGRLLLPLTRTIFRLRGALQRLQNRRSARTPS
jgi:hypothetical protein